MAFKSILPPSAERPTTQSRQVPNSQAFQRIIRESLSLTTLLLIGGLVQGTILILVPRVWILLPTLLVLLGRFSRTIAITLKFIPNPQMKGVIYPRTTALVPDRDGEFDKDGHPAKEQIAVLILASRINHPLGFFAPGMKELGELNEKMSKALDEEAPDNGFLGQTQWSSEDVNGSNNVMLLSYWRSIEDILAFSQGPTHRETWRWWNTHAQDLKHIGINHEIFQADKSMYESVYINFQPTGLGATSYLRKGDKMIGGTVPDTWVSPLVDASRGKLRDSHGRLGWERKGKATTVDDLY